MRANTFLYFVSFWLLALYNSVSAFDCNADSFGKVLPANATVTNATAVQAGGSYGDLSGGDQDFPALATALPSLCAVQIKISSSGNTFSFGLFLPDKWNNRLIGTGNTGFGGGINWPSMGHLVNYGMVAFSTDTGHNSNPNDPSWALNNNIGLTDWGYLAMHESVLQAKQVITAYYQSKINHSYYMGCSGAGRQGLKELQEFPDDFDGYAVGHPPWLLTHLHPWVAYVGNVNLPNNTDAHISPDLLSNLTDVVTSICDPQDGVTDAIVMSPWTCNFNSSQLLCQNSTQEVCLTEAQLPMFDKIWGNWVDDNNNLISPSLMIGADLSGLSGDSPPSTFGTGFIEDYIMNQTNWNWSTISPATVQLADSINPGSSNADQFDLSPFQATGGKIIHYHGLADPLIPPAFSIYYYEHVQKTMSANNATGLEDWYRLFLIPGMHHCSGSDGAPFYIAGGGQIVGGGNYSVPGFMDPQHDVVLAVINWVENGTAPDSIIATKWHNNSLSGGLQKQMPLCPYPQQAHYVGTGSIDEPQNWQCANGTAMNVPTITIGKEGSIPVTPSPTMGARPTPGGAVSLTPAMGWFATGLLSTMGFLLIQ
ncbi:MAG: hypothetical protein LQ340_000785 [Diploschistes diacapsis]|nr:MAG: hypothetical protein LQ340_000785 [Diploschistes diacapsis]